MIADFLKLRYERTKLVRSDLEVYRSVAVSTIENL